MSIQKKLTPKQEKELEALRKRWTNMTPAQKKKARTPSKPAPWPKKSKK